MYLNGCKKYRILKIWIRRLPPGFCKNSRKERMWMWKWEVFYNPQTNLSTLSVIFVVSSEWPCTRWTWLGRVIKIEIVLEFFLTFQEIRERAILFLAPDKKSEEWYVKKNGNFVEDFALNFKKESSYVKES